MIEVQPQRPEREVRSNVRSIGFHDPDARPSWRRYGKGVRQLQVDAARDRSWISIIATEIALADPALDEKRDVTKQAHFTLDAAAAAQLYSFLGEVFGYRQDEAVVRLEIEARKAQHMRHTAAATSVDEVGVQYRERWDPPFTYDHNRVEIDRARAVELLLGTEA